MISKEFDISVSEAGHLLKNAKSNVKRILGDGVAASHNRLLYMQNICEQCMQNPFRYAMKFYDTYWDCFLEHMTAFDHVIPVMDQLKKRGIVIGIITDLTAHIQYRKIAKLGLQDYIDHIVTSEEAGIEKPGRRIFELMLQKMELQPEEVLMVGDNIKKDIIGARDVGMHGILFERNEKDMRKLILDFIEDKGEKDV